MAACQGASDGIGSIAPCQGMNGCGSAQPRRQWLNPIRIDASLAGNGQQIQVDTRGLPATVNGRFAHVVGILIDVFADVVYAATTNAAVSYYQASSAFANLNLQDASGWQYFAALQDGRQILDDRFVRNGNYAQGETHPTDSWIAANHGTAETVSTPLNLYIQLSRMGYSGYGLEDAIPLAAIQAAGLSAFRFQMQAPAAMGTSVTWSKITAGTTVRVHFEVVYLDFVAVPRAWQLETYTEANTSGAVRHGDREHEYLVVRHLPEDTGGQALTDYDNVSLSCEGQALLSGMTRYEMFTRNSLIYGHDALQMTMAALYPSANTPAIFDDWTIYNTLFALMPPGQSGPENPRGVLSVNFGTRSTHTSTRYLHRTCACITPQRAQDITSSAFGCGGGGQPAKVVTVGVGPGGVAVPPQPNLPLAVIPNVDTVFRGANLLTPFVDFARRSSNGAPAATMY